MRVRKHRGVRADLGELDINWAGLGGAVMLLTNLLGLPTGNSSVGGRRACLFCSSTTTTYVDLIWFVLHVSSKTLGMTTSNLQFRRFVALETHHDFEMKQSLRFEGNSQLGGNCPSSKASEKIYLFKEDLRDLSTEDLRVLPAHRILPLSSKDRYSFLQVL